MDSKSLRNCWRPRTRVDKIAVGDDERADYKTSGVNQQYLLQREMMIRWVVVLTIPIMLQQFITAGIDLNNADSTTDTCKCHPFCPIHTYDKPQTHEITYDTKQVQDNILPFTNDVKGGFWSECLDPFGSDDDVAYDDDTADPDWTKGFTANPTDGVRYRNFLVNIGGENYANPIMTNPDGPSPNQPLYSQMCCMDGVQDPSVRAGAAFKALSGMWVAVTSLVSFCLMAVAWWAQAKQGLWAKSSKYMFAGWFINFAMILLLFLIPLHLVAFPTADEIKILISGIMDDALYTQNFVLAVMQTVTGITPTAAFSALDFFAKLINNLMTEITPVGLDMTARVVFTMLSCKSVLPLALSLLPGIQKGAVLCKMVFPDSPLFGWIAWVVPVFYVPIVAAILMMALQVLATTGFTLGVFFLIASAVCPLFLGQTMTKMYKTTDDWLKAIAGQNVIKARIVLLAAALISFAVFGYRMADAQSVSMKALADGLKGMLSMSNMFFLVVGFFRGFCLTSVVATDALLHLTFAMRADERASPELAQHFQEATDVAQQTLHSSSTKASKQSPSTIELGEKSMLGEKLLSE